MRPVQIPFLFSVHASVVTASEIPVVEGQLPADSAAVERLRDALDLARAGQSAHTVADLEDAIFRVYLPMARALALTAGDESSAEHGRSEQAAELGLAWCLRHDPDPDPGNVADTSAPVNVADDEQTV